MMPGYRFLYQGTGCTHRNHTKARKWEYTRGEARDRVKDEEEGGRRYGDEACGRGTREGEGRSATGAPLHPAPPPPPPLIPTVSYTHPRPKPHQWYSYGTSSMPYFKGFSSPSLYQQEILQLRPKYHGSHSKQGHLPLPSLSSYLSLLISSAVSL